MNKEEIIQAYIDGYNEYNVDKMVANFDEAIAFQNISNGQVTLSLEGLAAFKEQAEQAKAYFSSRTQTIKSFHEHGDEVQVHIHYRAILAMDLSNDLKTGSELALDGKSVFKFSGEKITSLTDIS